MSSCFVSSTGCFVKSAKVCPAFTLSILPPASHGSVKDFWSNWGFSIKHRAGTGKGYKNA